MIVRIGPPLLLAVLAGVLWTIAAAAPEMDWNAARLYPTHLIAAGVAPYPLPSHGVTTGWIYGPVMSLLHLPAVVAPTLTASLVISGIINQTAFLLPGAAVLGIACRDLRQSRAVTLSGMIIAGGIVLAVPQTRDYLYWIHCDQVAIGFALASCGALAHALGRPGSSRWLAAGLAAAAVWSKQVAILLPLGQVLAVALLTRDVRQTGWFTLQLLGAGVVLAAGFATWFGLDRLVFNLWVVPAGHGFKPPGANLAAVVEFLIVTGPATGAALWAKRKLTADETLAGRLLTILLISGWVQTPLQLWSATKVGAGQNSGHATVLLLAAGLIGLIVLLRSIPGAPRPAWRLGWSALVLGFGITQASSHLPMSLWPVNHREADVQLAATHPGEIYFPDNPLVSWWAERRAYHLEYGLVDQAAAGFPASPQNYADFTPENLRLVIYAPQTTLFICPQVHPDLVRDPAVTWRPVFRRSD